MHGAWSLLGSRLGVCMVRLGVVRHILEARLPNVGTQGTETQTDPPRFFGTPGPRPAFPRVEAPTTTSEETPLRPRRRCRSGDVLRRGSMARRSPATVVRARLPSRLLSLRSTGSPFTPARGGGSVPARREGLRGLPRSAEARATGMLRQGSSLVETRMRLKGFLPSRQDPGRLDTPREAAAENLPITCRRGTAPLGASGGASSPSASRTAGLAARRNSRGDIRVVGSPSGAFPQEGSGHFDLPPRGPAPDPVGRTPVHRRHDPFARGMPADKRFEGAENRLEPAAAVPPPVNRRDLSKNDRRDTAQRHGAPPLEPYNGGLGSRGPPRDESQTGYTGYSDRRPSPDGWGERETTAARLVSNRETAAFGRVGEVSRTEQGERHARPSGGNRRYDRSCAGPAPRAPCNVRTAPCHQGWDAGHTPPRGDMPPACSRSALHAASTYLPAGDLTAPGARRPGRPPSEGRDAFRESPFGDPGQRPGPDHESSSGHRRGPALPPLSVELRARPGEERFSGLRETYVAPPPQPVGGPEQQGRVTPRRDGFSYHEESERDRAAGEFASSRARREIDGLRNWNDTSQKAHLRARDAPYEDSRRDHSEPPHNVCSSRGSSRYERDAGPAGARDARGDMDVSYGARALNKGAGCHEREFAQPQLKSGAFSPDSDFRARESAGPISEAFVSGGAPYASSRNGADSRPPAATLTLTERPGARAANSGRGTPEDARDAAGPASPAQSADASAASGAPQASVALNPLLPQLSAAWASGVALRSSLGLRAALPVLPSLAGLSQVGALPSIGALLPELGLQTPSAQQVLPVVAPAVVPGTGLPRSLETVLGATPAATAAAMVNAAAAAALVGPDQVQQAQQQRAFVEAVTQLGLQGHASRETTGAPRADGGAERAKNKDAAGATEEEKSGAASAAETSNDSRLLRELSQVDPAQLDPATNTDAHNWCYLDNDNQCQGPFDTLQMLRWYERGFFDPQRPVRRDDEAGFTPLNDGKRLLDVALRIVNLSRVLRPVSRFPSWGVHSDIHSAAASRIRAASSEWTTGLAAQSAASAPQPLSASPSQLGG
ncbi:hypothetical protein BESB_078920 [Besnoitia besnoiti]|uniref:GYF domain-containing protein n=1 Tax=Besnoitia besnoiti TaxID=94643 RepID=A0A2A9MCL8_BESBE|nr:hypothetical protein BESB_078920 [Besnoitia besnoiti]PFH33676.1 hypothetical protein BESB_078920 [Besnoitia besnoiti]